MPSEELSMIPDDIVAEAQRLLALGTLSHRRIAAQLHISRCSVSNIARGQRTCHSTDHAQHAAHDMNVPSRAKRLEFSSLPCGPFVRCPGCGGRVVVPCRLCRVRKIQHQLRLERSRWLRGAPTVEEHSHETQPAAHECLAADRTCGQVRPKCDSRLTVMASNTGATCGRSRSSA